ncbi:fasciclin domain containing protein [Nitzschia inconspicua]|uniref:Fasciclin domain containing protein n=1 Tax=Nitzschia inconspicua TaxID=303405 RepID=A0A9K3K446_9STRA|nr:fasciclin domain containing protein [Nitzschia inconspicua]KAG7359338.1 fasciclin domain containing protein [Nitzschia inconspicua]
MKRRRRLPLFVPSILFRLCLFQSFQNSFNVVVLVSAQRTSIFYGLLQGRQVTADFLETKAIGFEENEDQDESQQQQEEEEENGGQVSADLLEGEQQPQPQPQPTDENQDGCLSIVETICSLRGGFDMACTFFGNFDFQNNINYTAFVPTDSAFDSLQQLELQLTNSTNMIQSLIPFHLVTNQTLLASDLNCQERIEMSNGQDSRTICSNATTVVKKFQKGADNIEPIPIIIQDLPACNGIIHIVDGVLLPDGIFGEESVTAETTSTLSPSLPSSSSTTTNTNVPTQQPPTPSPSSQGQTSGQSCIPVMNFICGSRVVSTFCNLIRAYNLEDSLNEASDITVFAPYNVAFEHTLVDDLSFDEARDVLIFHATAPNRAISTQDLQCGELLPMANGKDTRTYCSDRSNDIFQKGVGNPLEKMPRVLVRDIPMCRNIMVHIVDRVLLPSEPQSNARRRKWRHQVRR